MRVVPLAATLSFAVASVLTGARAEAQTPVPPAVSPAAPLRLVAQPEPVPEPEPPPPFRGNAAMLASGVVVAAVGAALLVGGGVLVAQGSAASSPSFDSDSNPWLGIGNAAGIAMLCVGAAQVVIGVPLILVGARPSPRGPTATPPPAYAWMVPKVTGGPRGSGFGWTF